MDPKALVLLPRSTMNELGHTFVEICGPVPPFATAGVGDL